MKKRGDVQLVRMATADGSDMVDPPNSERDLNGDDLKYKYNSTFITTSTRWIYICGSWDGVRASIVNRSAEYLRKKEAKLTCYDSVFRCYSVTLEWF